MAEERNQQDTATHGVTKFSDWTDAEFQALLTFRHEGKSVEHVTPKVAPVDWSEHVTEVRDQGAECGSSWAFAVVEAVETTHEVNCGIMDELSVQQLLDCDTSSFGCMGGYLDSAAEYMIKTDKWNTWADYPYTGKRQDCQSNTGTIDLCVSGHAETAGVEELHAAIMRGAPAVAADATTWVTYQEGILSNCGTNVNHPVQVVGIDADGNYKLRNTWGTDWGENGYIRIAAGNTCGIASIVSSPY